MEEVKPYKYQEETTRMLAEPSATAVLHQRQVQDLRHHVMDAVYASQDTKLLRFCLVLLQNTEDSTKKEFFDRLAELGSLKPGWDGEGSKPISLKVLAFTGSILEKVSASLLKNWVLFPDARGYIYFDYTHGKDIAGITVSENGMTAFVKKNGKLSKYSLTELSEQKLEKVLEKVYE